MIKEDHKTVEKDTERYRERERENSQEEKVVMEDVWVNRFY